MPIETLAQIGYNAYGDAVNWKSHTGKGMPTWEELAVSGKAQRDAWITAADAIIRAGTM